MVQVNERDFSGDVCLHGPCVVVSLRGELDPDALPEADDLLAQASTMATGDVWVEVGELSFISAGGLGALAALAARLAPRGGRVRLVGVSPMLRRLLDLTELTPHVEIQSAR